MSMFPPRDRSWHPPALYQPYKSSRLRSPNHAPIAFPTTPGEEAGPTFGHAILGPLDHDLITNFAQPGEMGLGPRLIVHGAVRDDNGRGVHWLKYGRPMPQGAIVTRKRAT